MAVPSSGDSSRFLYMARVGAILFAWNCPSNTYGTFPSLDGEALFNFEVGNYYDRCIQIHLFVCSFIHSSIASFIHLLIHSFIHSFMYLFTPFPLGVPGMNPDVNSKIWSGLTACK